MDAHITNIQKETLVEDNSTYLAVSFDILDDEGTQIAHRKRAFPLDTPQEEIEKDVKAEALNQKAELVSLEANKDTVEANSQADKIIESLKDKQL